ncbi:MAG: hypothetical protein IIB40_06900 [Candidatus Marinimicrobia bacterium]|nr:hypothetical protein [Candidatus Neomarinimicrobiota bacterium]
MDVSLLIKTLSLSLFMSSANIQGEPYDRLFEFAFRGELFSASRVWERTNGIEYSGERIIAKSPKYRGAKIEMEHFKRSAQSINSQSMRAIYQIVGYEAVFQDYFELRRDMAWVGYSRTFKGAEFRSSFSSDFSGFDKSELIISYKLLLAEKIFIKPTFESSRIGSDKYWRIKISFDYDLEFGKPEAID